MAFSRSLLFCSRLVDEIAGFDLEESRVVDSYFASLLSLRNDMADLLRRMLEEEKKHAGAALPALHCVLSAYAYSDSWSVTDNLHFVLFCSSYGRCGRRW